MVWNYKAAQKLKTFVGPSKACVLWKARCGNYSAGLKTVIEDESGVCELKRMSLKDMLVMEKQLLQKMRFSAIKAVLWRLQMGVKWCCR